MSKIAIKGHKTRGKEVIQILESLGGNNLYTMTGSAPDSTYYINSYYNIDVNHLECVKQMFQVYTLEEFEKEFPFKIGDEVMFPVKIRWASGKVTGLTYVKDKLKYEVYSRTSGYHYVESHKLSLYPMQEERNITLTLDKAKEWYKAGGDLKEVALQAYTKEELNKIELPKSWEEYCKNTLKINWDSYAINNCTVAPTKKHYKQYQALMKLHQLRDCWRQGWEPNWLEGNVQKYVIKRWRDKSSIETTYVTHSFLSFPTYEMAKEFLECFKDLIEKAGDLI